MPAAALLALSRALHGCRDLQQVLDQVREMVRKHTRYDRIYVQLPAEDRKSYTVAGYVLPDLDKVVRQVAEVELDKDPFLQMVLALEEPLVIPDVRKHPLADQRHVEAFGLRTAMVFPMFDGEVGIGPLNAATFADQGVVEPTPEELELLTQVASLVGVVIARLRAEQSRVELEHKLVATQKMEALGRLAGEVAHDFNNLLLAILGNADLAESELKGQAAAEYLRNIKDATLRAAGLSRQLLAFSKGQVLESQVLDVNPLVERTLGMLERLIPKAIQLDFSSSSRGGLVKGDRGQLEQVLMNLVLNARDALPSGGRIVVETQVVRVDEEFVASHAQVHPGRYVLLTVADDGEGMSPEVQQRIFEPFFTTKPEERGTGLGLSVVQGIVSQHDGYIHVYSESGVGTTFKIYLPLAEQPAAHVGPKHLPPRAYARGTERILLIDDDEHVRNAIGAILDRSGYHVIRAATGDEALRVQEAPDLLLSDVVMPSMGGVELAERLTKRWPGLRVLLMTGYSPVQVRVEWPHLSKPFTPTDLKARLREVLDGEEPAAS